MRTLASSSQGKILLWNTDDHLRTEFHLESLLFPGRANISFPRIPYPQFCFNRDGGLLLAYAVHMLEIWDLRLRKKKREIFVDFPVFWASFSADGQYIIYAGLRGATKQVAIVKEDTEETVFKSNEPGQKITGEHA